MIGPNRWAGRALAALLVTGTAVAGGAPGDASAPAPSSLPRAPAEAPASTPWTFAETPDWVEPVAPFATPAAAGGPHRDGVEWRLLEHQFDGRVPGTGVSWHAREYAFLNRHGVEERSRLEIDFDPAYQRLALHELSVRRGERVLDRRATARIDLLREERRGDALIHDGEHTLHLLLGDVRVGDVVRLAYSLSGENPVLATHRELTVPTERRGASLGRQRTRLLTTGARPFHVRTRGRAVAPAFRAEGGVHEHVVDLLEPPLAEEEPDVPPDARDGGLVVFGDLPDWASVVDWARPLYRLGETRPPELVALAARIRAAHPDDEAARVAAALRWVQNEIRYFGIELGVHSHRPASPATTLARRFGDCKGKTLLLIALLDALGVAASPALVDTWGETAGERFPWRLHAFDHVLVHVAGESRSHWLDPTLGYQRGTLGELHEPDHGRALVLAPGERGLRDMGNPASGRRATIEKRLALPSERAAPATLDVGTTHRGRTAAGLRREIDRDGTDALGRRYLEYYETEFAGLSPRAAPEASEAADGALHVTERYAVPDFWNDRGRGAERWLFADEIDAHLDERLAEAAVGAGRVRPLALEHPVELVERWHVERPEPFASEVPDARVDTPWFSLERTRTVGGDGRALVASWRYRSRADRIEPGELDRYREALEAARRIAGFRLEGSPVADPPVPAPALAGLGGVLGLGGLGGLAAARRRRRGRRPGARVAAPPPETPSRPER